jgi:membrane-bound serine protease (ClpP class)
MKHTPVSPPRQGHLAVSGLRLRKGAILGFFTLIAAALAIADPVAGQTGPGVAAVGINEGAITVTQDVDRAARVLEVTITGAITPVADARIREGIARAEQGGFDAYLIRLDTPGGLDTSMRRIVQAIYAAEVPVVVHIAPAGARGGSAGAIITFAAHVAAMAPGTAIGAATPVSGGDGGDLDTKIVNDAVAYAAAIAEFRGRDRTFITETVSEGRSGSAQEALDVGAIDVIASSTADLLTEIDGWTVVLGPTEREVTLQTAGATVETQDMGIFRSIQQLLADPNVAFLLLSIGTLGLIYELASPGIGVGAVLGLTFIVLGLFGAAVLSVNFVGIVFLILAGVLFTAEIFAPGIGLAAGGGMFALIMSGIFLFDDAPGLEISLIVIVPAALVVGGFVIMAGRMAMRIRRSPSVTTGAGVLVGHEATVRVRTGAAQVFIAGAWWAVHSAVPLVDGQLVRITAMDGLHLEAAPVDADHMSSLGKGVQDE